MHDKKKMFVYCITKIDGDSQRFSLDDGIVSCPFCHDLEDVCTVFQSDDYVHKINMVWCDSCGARCAVPSDAANDKEYMNAKYRITSEQVPYELLQKLDFDGNPDHYLCYQFPLLKIHKVINSDMADFSAEHPVDQERLKQFIASGFDPRFGFQSTADADLDERSVEGFDFNLGLVIDSYNATDAEEFLNMAHDGVYIFLQCYDLEGHLFGACYWGD